MYIHVTGLNEPIMFKLHVDMNGFEQQTSSE